MKALVIHSGGQDSTTSLLWALKNFDDVSAIHFRYGQRHEVETKYALQSAKILGVRTEVIQLDFLKQIANSALLEPGDISKKNAKGLPSSFVPNRNQLFITIAHSLAQKIGAGHLVTGVCQTDYSGYPDCRADFVSAIESASNLGSGENIKIHTPLMYLTKAETFELADRLGHLYLIINETMTCYEGLEKLNEFGRGCGVCPACRLRDRGYSEFRSKT